jgi:hypothetical protein
MIVAGSASPLLLASAGGYNLTRSLRLRSSASATLTRSVAGVNTTQLTFSAWFKLSCNTSNDNTIFATQNNSSNYLLIGFGGDLTLDVQIGGTANRRRTTQVFRDPSAWYHLVVTFDTTQATASDRIKVYVNGNQVTAFGTNTTGMSQNSNLPAISSSLTNYIGGYNGSAGYYFDGNMTEINCVYGQALTPSSFGATNAQTGVWQPIKYVGSYGTNGFYLPFSDNTSTTTLGADSSGNGNNWTTNNISLTAGSTYDSMTDVPTLTSATAANFPVLNPIAGVASGSSYTITQGNLNAVLSSSANVIEVPATMALPTSGKWYWETNIIAVNTTFAVPCAIGISDQGGIGTAGSFANNYYYYVSKTGNKFSNGTNTAYGATYTASDVIGVALDMDAGTLVFYKNNTSQGTAYTGLSGTYYPKYGSSDGCTVAPNFGQRPFTYTPPTGFVALNTFNLPTPTIGATASTQANKYFDATLYTGNGTGQSITNSGSMQPDLIWFKNRSGANSHALADSVRGANKILSSNNTDADYTTSAGNDLLSFNSNGFTVGAYGAFASINASGASEVAWQWRASNATAVTNTAGSITSTVSANTSAGFSVVTYTEPASGSYTFGHGLGVSPSMFIVKERNVAGNNWVVWHNYFQSVDPIPTKKGLYLNSTAAAFTTGSDWLNSISSTTIGITTGQVTSGGATMVAYCFSEVAGYSKFGSYTGNGSTDGTFVYTGFRPKFVLLKSTNSVANWILYDTARATYNVVNNILLPDSSSAELTSADYNVDIVSNGFKFRTAQGGINGSGNIVIYMAFAESPFKYANAR